MSSTTHSNIDQGEINKFNRMASRWWDPNGEFKPLHQLNPVRANYIDIKSPVAEKRLLDVGCGGGILSEAMAQRGAEVTAIDMAEDALEVAKLHAKEGQLDINYLNTSAEAFAGTKPGEFEIVTCLELIEHVPSPDSLLEACAQLLKPGGDLFVSTINRNLKAYGMAILGAEYILNWLPRGTHEYKKFIRPSELAAWARKHHLLLCDIKGLVYNPFTREFSLSDKDVDVNYICHFQKIK